MDEELKKKLAKLAEDNEVKPEEVIALFEVVRIRVKEEDSHLGDIKLDRRTYNGLLNYFSNKKFSKGKEFIFIPFGIASEARDQSLKLRTEILKEFGNPEKRKGLIEQGKIVCMKVSNEEIDNKNVFYTDVYKPVRKILKWTLVDNIYVVTESELWEPGDTPIARDFRINLEYGEGEDASSYENFRFSYPLDPRWKLTLFGLGYFPGFREEITETGMQKVQKAIKSDGVISKVTFYGDFADPNNTKFVCKKPIWFIPCKLKGTETSMSTKLVLNITAKTELEMSDMKPKIQKLVDTINKRIEKEMKIIYNQGKEARSDENTPEEKMKKILAKWKLYSKYAGKDYIPIIDLADLHKFHIEYKAIRDENDNIVKDDAWDKIDFDSFALCECTFSGMFEKEGKKPKMILSDFSLPENQSSMFIGFAKGLATDLPSSSVIISLTTARGNQVYDPDTKTWIEDEENAKAFGKVKGIRVLVDFTKIDIEKLFGDL